MATDNCPHEAWDERGGYRLCCDCKTWLDDAPPPASADALGEVEAPCYLCAGKCRGHPLDREGGWDPEPGSRAHAAALSAMSPAGEVERIVEDINAMMRERVTNWPEPKKLSTAIALIDKTIRTLLDPPKHQFWGAGEADCPREIKAGNGELHTLRCKVCGEDNPRDDRCLLFGEDAIERGDYRND